MVIDDDKALLDIMSAILGALGCGSETFHEGGRALKALAEPGKVEQIDAIFLDVMMPEMDGYEVLAQLRAAAHTQNIPIIMLTAKGGYDQIIKGYNEGADYYITKPVTKDQLVFALDLLLSGSEGEALDPSDMTQWSHVLREAD
jgi:DNA-binding response OmpR family regulator